VYTIKRIDKNEGFLTSRPGLGYFVRLDLPKTGREKRDLFESLAADFVGRALELGYSRDDIMKRILHLLGPLKPVTSKED
jgi:DNA-binding transcriptional regulator YhcF (GntR family)